MGATEYIQEAGIVGEGGAGFPTHVKVNCKAECVIGNGAECEPLLRVDQQIMQFYPERVVDGIAILMEQTGASRGVIALKDHYHEAIAALEKEIAKRSGIELHIMKSTYPAGDEQQIVYSVLGRVVPTGGLPLDVGAVVSNVGTLMDISLAKEGAHVTDKFVTVGGAVREPVTLRVPIGTNAAELIAAAGGLTEPDCKFIIGGPCMGRVSETADFPVTKTTGGLLAIPSGHSIFRRKENEINVQMMKAVCCQCTMCTQMCPRNALGLHVEPHKAMRSVATGMDLIGDATNGLFSCCDCGICTYYACNFDLKPSRVMQSMKQGLSAAGVKPTKEVYGPVDEGLENKKLPVSRLIARLGVAAYDQPAPMRHDILPVREVTIPLRMHIGAPSLPVVQKGQAVQKGQLIADIPEKALGAKIHASISGTVIEVTEEFVKIQGGTA